MLHSSLSFQRPRRSLISVPAINQRALDKCLTLDADGVIFDLEDSVAAEKKHEARDNLRSFWSDALLPDREKVIRINELSSIFHEADMELVIELEPDAVLLPKITGADEILDVQGRLDKAASSTGLKIWVMMETARGLLDVAPIAGSREKAERLDAFVIGLNDLRKETRVPPRPERTFLIPWMMQVVLAARAHGLSVIDSVFNDFRDAEAFSAECLQGREMGFDGKMLIHPAQIEAANCIFGPLPEDVAEARDIVTAFSTPEAAHLNVINLNGRMVERLHLEEAERLLALAQYLEERRTT